MRQNHPESLASSSESRLNGGQGVGLTPLTVRIPTATRLTGIGRSKLYELINEGELDVVKIGASTLITVDSLKRLLERNKR